MIRALLVAFGLISLPVWATAEPQAPQALVIIACRTDDLTNVPGRSVDQNAIATGHRDIEFHVQGGELECKRELTPLEDAVAATHPEVRALLSNFGDWTQCSRASAMFSPDWERLHPGWSVMTTGCPTRMVNDVGQTVGWHMPECPSEIIVDGSPVPITCKFDDSMI